MTKKEEIINIVKKLLIDETIDSLSLSKIAKKVELGKSTLYHYFNSKEELYQEVLSRIVDSQYNKIKEINKQNEPKNSIIAIINYFFDKDFEDIKIIDNEMYINYFKYMRLEDFTKFNEILTIFDNIIKSLNKNVNSRLIFNLIIITSKNFHYKEKFNVKLDEKNLMLNEIHKETKEIVIKELNIAIDNLLKG